MNEDICFLSATDLQRKLRTKDLSSIELTQAYIERIESINPELNAVVTFEPEKALAQAKDADERLARAEHVGVLQGLPVAHKDLFNTKGMRTTYASPIFKDFVPLVDDLIIERQRQAGAITLGKTNTPEFGAGSQTFNEVFGATRNPYDTHKTCGGSSGGAAVALAAGMVALADGSDMGGSLRNPAAFCNIVGFRPTPGRVPSPGLNNWGTLGVAGPMARTVQDIALFMSAIAGPDARVPISQTDPASIFSKPLERDFKATRIAWALDTLDIPFTPEVIQTLEPLRSVFVDLGCEVDSPQLDFRGADEAFKMFRAHAFAGSHHKLLEKHREQLKETVIWNIEEGLKLSALDIAIVEQKRTQLFVRIAKLMQDYDFIVLPTTQVAPFDIETEYIKEINDVQMETYIDWMKSCYFISTIGNPAISVPGGFTESGLPIGLQIVGRYGADFEVLQMAHAFEQATQFGLKRPNV